MPRRSTLILASAVVAAGAAVVLALPSSTPPGAGLSSTACDDGDSATNDSRTYPQRRQFVEAQGWWTKNPGAPAATLESGHVHSGACIPERETVTGSWDLYFRVMLHNHAGAFKSIRAITKGKGYENKFAEQTAGNGFLDGQLTEPAPSTWNPPDGATETRWFKLTVTNGTHFKNGSTEVHGRQEVRVRVFTDIPDDPNRSSAGNFVATLIFQVNVPAVSGSVLSDFNREPYTRAHGQYNDGTGEDNSIYCESAMKGATTTDPAVPDDPVGVTWQPWIVQADHDTGEPDRPVSAHYGSINPQLHAVPPNSGINVPIGPDADDDFPASNPPFVEMTPTFGQITVDGSVLATGVTHRLMLRAECDMDEAAAEYTQTEFPTVSIRPVKDHMHATLSAVLMVPFRVS